MKRVTLFLSVFLLVVMIFASHASAVLGEVKISASDGASSNYFGSQVAISGNFAFVVATNTAKIGFDGNSMAVYIYYYDGTNWVEHQKLTNRGGGVAISGEYAIVGGATKDDGRGTAYIYHYDGSNWVEQQELSASDGSPSFGRVVSISADGYAIVGSLVSYHTGAVYIFHYDGTSWVEHQKLVNKDGALDDMFGSSVAISGEHAIVGASWTKDADRISVGAVYIFNFDGTNWVEQQKLSNNAASGGWYFGTSVSISGSSLIVGAPIYNGYTGLGGSAYIFKFDGTNWVMQQELSSRHNMPRDGFGQSVSISGDNAVVGAPYNSGVDFYTGAAYLFHNDGSGWVESMKLASDNLGFSTNYGKAVSISDNRIIVGVPNDDGWFGSAYIYDTLPTTDPNLPADVDGDGYDITVDCNDKVSSINPGASEVCGDGKDNNCDGMIDSEDSICAHTPPVCIPTFKKEKGKRCYDGIDNDCDGLIDGADLDCGGR